MGTVEADTARYYAQQEAADRDYVEFLELNSRWVPARADYLMKCGWSEAAEKYEYAAWLAEEVDLRHAEDKLSRAVAMQGPIVYTAAAAMALHAARKAWLEKRLWEQAKNEYEENR